MDKKQNVDSRKRKKDVGDGVTESTPKRPETVRRVTRLSLSSSPFKKVPGGDNDLPLPPSGRWHNPSASRRNLALGSTSRASQTLPTRLFAHNLIPASGRINSYSKPEYLVSLREIMDGSQEFDYLLDTQFGNLFEIQTRRAVLSGKLVHQFLCRALVTRKKHELWLVFGGKPIRFSLKEFAYLTGLFCDPYPPAEQMDRVRKAAYGKRPFWNRLFGDRKDCQVADIIEMLRYDKQQEPSERMSSGKRLRLALLVLVEGVLIPSSSCPKASREVVEMVNDIETFLDYPWGRKSFELTLEMVMWGNSVNPTVDSLRDKLSTSHLTTKGFTLAFQLLILATVPKVVRLLPTDQKWFANFLDKDIKALPKFNRFHNHNILTIEMSQELQVNSILEFGFPVSGEDFSWPDEVEDPGVDHLMYKLRHGYDFKPNEWVVAAVVEPLQIAEPIMDREMVLGLRRAKQGTIRKMLRRKNNVDKDTEQDGISIEGGIDGCQTNNIDKLFAEKREKFINAFDVILSELKNEFIGQRDFGQTNKLKELKKGSEVEVKRSSDRGKGKKITQVVDGIDSEDSSADHTRMTETDQSEKGEDASTLPRDDVDVIVHSVLGDLTASDGQTDNGNAQGEDKDDELTALDNEQLDRMEADGGTVEGLTVMAFPAGNKQVEGLGTGNVELAGGQDEENGNNVIPCDEDTMLPYEDEDIEALKDAELTPEAMDGDDSDESVKSGEAGGDSVKGRDEDEPPLPLRIKREIKLPKKYGQDDVQTVTGGSKDISLSMSSNESMPLDEYPKKQFLAKLASYRQREYLINGHPQPKAFFKVIYRPGNHVGTEHMEAMLTCMWRRLSTNLLERRVVVLDTWFTQLLVTDHGRYSKARRGTSTFNWNSTLRKYVLGEVSGRNGKVAWLVDVDRVFAPMIMGKNHWVAICIDLKDGSVTVYDSIKNLNSEAKVAKSMKPITEIMPALLEEVSMRHAAVYKPADVFVYKRPENVSQNIRGGDCGPLSIKFIELSAQGMSVEGITDEMADQLRMMYAIEVYNEFVEPIG